MSNYQYEEYSSGVHEAAGPTLSLELSSYNKVVEGKRLRNVNAYKSLAGLETQGLSSIEIYTQKKIEHHDKMKLQSTLAKGSNRSIGDRTSERESIGLPLIYSGQKVADLKKDQDIVKANKYTKSRSSQISNRLEEPDEQQRQLRAVESKLRKSLQLEARTPQIVSLTTKETPINFSKQNGPISALNNMNEQIIETYGIRSSHLKVHKTPNDAVNSHSLVKASSQKKLSPLRLAGLNQQPKRRNQNGICSLGSGSVIKFKKSIFESQVSTSIGVSVSHQALPQEFYPSVTTPNGKFRLNSSQMVDAQSWEQQYKSTQVQDLKDIKTNSKNYSICLSKIKRDMKLERTEFKTKQKIKKANIVSSMLLNKMNSVDPNLADANSKFQAKAGTSLGHQAKSLQPGLVSAKQELSAIMRDPIPTSIKLRQDIKTPLDLPPKGAPTYVACNLSGLLPPARFNLDYQQGIEPPYDLKIYLSFKNRKPDASDYDKVVKIKPKTISLYEYDRNLQKIKEFTGDTLFLSLVSEIGGALVLTHTTSEPADEVKKKPRRQKQEEELETISEDDPYYLQMLKLERERQQRHHNAREQKQGNFLSQFTKPEQILANTEQVQSRLNENLENKHKQKVFYLIRRDCLKQIRSQKSEESYQKKVNQWRGQQFLINMGLIYILRFLGIQYRHRYELRFRQERCLFLQFIIRYRFERGMKRFGRSREQRKEQQVKMSMMFGYNLAFQARAVAQSKNIIFLVLLHADRNRVLLARLDTTFFQIRFIQYRFRNLREIMKQRTRAIRTVILAKETAEMAKQLAMVMTKEALALAEQIRILSDAKRDFITECFIQLAKFDFRVQFLKWFKETKASEIDAGKVAELQEGIDQGDQMINSLVDFASSGTDQVLGDFEKLFGKNTRRNAIIDASEILENLNVGGKKKHTQTIKDLDSIKQKMNQKSKKNKQKARSSKNKDIPTQEPALDDLKKSRAITLLARHFQRTRMPTFAIFSRLDKRLIKLMLIKATEYFDEDIPELRKRFFNPEDLPIVASEPTNPIDVTKTSIEPTLSNTATSQTHVIHTSQSDEHHHQSEEEELQLQEYLRRRSGQLNSLLYNEVKGQNMQIVTPESLVHEIYKQNAVSAGEEEDLTSGREELSKKRV